MVVFSFLVPLRYEWYATGIGTFTIDFGSRIGLESEFA